MPLSPEQLGRIDDTQMVEIETRNGDQTRRTIIWVMVDDGEVFVRSVRGPAGRWYQRALANPEVALIVGAESYPFRASRRHRQRVGGTGFERTPRQVPAGAIARRDAHPRGARHHPAVGPDRLARVQAADGGGVGVL